MRPTRASGGREQEHESDSRSAGSPASLVESPWGRSREAERVLEWPPRSRRPRAVLPKRLALLCATALPLLAPGAARAMCNVIPAATQDFRAALGSANRPFAGPGEWVELRVRTAVCDSESTGFANVNGIGTASDDYVVTILFVPPDPPGPQPPGPPNAVVLAPSCADPDLQTAINNCDVAVECVQDPTGLVVVSASEFQFRFPDTSFAGPAKLVVSRLGQSLHCDLAGHVPEKRCAGLGGTTDTNGVVACVDELYPLDGTCRTRDDLNPTYNVDPTFGHFTALPKPNDFAAMCTTPGTACEDGAPELHFTTDLAGNALVPMDYTKVLLRPNGVPVAQLARAATSLEAVPGDGPVALPGDRFIRSYSPEGVILPPIFTPLSDPESTDATLFGAVDAARGTIRIARRGCVEPDREGDACDSSCTCSDPLFEFRDRYSEGGVGPVVVPGGPSPQYTATLDAPVPLEGLIEGDEAFGFVLSEALPPSGGGTTSLNADADTTDFVATLRDRDTGILQPIGLLEWEGRAVVRVHRPPFFSFPAVETRGDLLVFLESEPAEGGVDFNANGAVFDSLLRVFRLGTSAVLTGGNQITADAAPLVNGRSFALSNGRVFFRTSEAAEADQVVRMMSVKANGEQPTGGQAGPSSSASISGDGRFVAFASLAKRLVDEDNNAIQDVFVHDRDLDGYGVFDEPGQIQLTRISVDGAGAAANGASGRPAITPDGRFVAFESDATNLVPGSNGKTDVFLRDRANATTERVSLTDGELEPNGRSFAAHLSSDGRFVEFASVADDLMLGDANGDPDTFVRDRTAGTTVRVSVADDGSERNGTAGSDSGGALSTDGRYVLFSTDAPLVAGDANNVADAFVRDRDSDGDGVLDEASAASTSRVDITSFAVPASGGQVGGASALTPDGRFLAFESGAPELVGAGAIGVFMHDRDADEDGTFGETAAVFPELPEISTRRADVSSGGVPFDAVSGRPSLSADGRYVAFDCLAKNPAACDGVYLHDTLTGHTLQASAVGGVAANGFTGSPALSGDGRYVAFESQATNLVDGDANATSDVFVRGPDPQDAAADRTGDGDLDDTVLRILDPSAGPPATIIDLCPAQDVAVAGGNAAFLRPERAGPAVGCPAPGLTGSLNGDLDAVDDVVHLSMGGAAPVNLGVAASAVGLSDSWIAALVHDGGQSDEVWVAPMGPEGAGAWTDLGLVADALQVEGTRVAFTVPEPFAGGTRRILHVYDAGGLVDTGQAAEEFVLGEHLVAFRTLEAAQGQRLNGSCDPILEDDCDLLDGVLQIYLLATGELINTRQAVLPCPFVACDPRRPYRVATSTVRFLTLESQQNEDLNDNGDEDDLLVQVYNVYTREARVVGEVAIDAALASDPSTSVDPLEAPQPDTGRPAPGEQVLVGEGRCIVETGATCLDAPICPPGQFCSGTGICLQDVGQSCLPGQPPGEQGCSPGAECTSELVAIGVADADADEVPDFLDNCPATPNVAQAGLDLDGFGDACDLETCSNAVLEPGEECEDTDLLDGDGCDSNCRVTACSNGIRTDPEQCDDGNALAVDGCTGACLIEVADAWAFAGEASGGSVSFRVGGIDFTVTTLLGQTAAEVAASVAAAIRAHPALAGHAVYAAGTGSSVISNASITNRSISDPGLTTAAVPSLGPPALGALALGLLLAGLLALHRASRASA